MTADCNSLVRGKLLRVTKLGPCGEVLYDPTDPTWPIHAVMKCFASVEYELETDDGEEINEKDANDDQCVLIPPCPTNKWYNVTATLKRVDPELFSIMTGWPVVLNDEGIATGFRVNKKVNCDSGVGLEVWTGTASDTRCAGTVPKPKYGFLLIPFLTAANISGFTINNGLASFVITGKGIAGGAWGVGPYPIYETAEGGVAALADPIDDENLLHVDVTTLPPPPPTCGIVPRPPDFTLSEQVTDVTGMTTNLVLSYIPAGPPPHTSTVHWGDGETSAAPVVTGGPGIDHEYADAGTYQVRVVDDVTGSVRLKTVTVPYV